MDGQLKRLIPTGFLFLRSSSASARCRGRSYSAGAVRSIETRGDFNKYERRTISIFDRVSPSVVQVADSTDDSDSNDEETSVKTGTGFVWDAAGHVVTNYHVVQDAKALTVKFASGETRKASIVGVAPSYDLAVIHIDGKGIPAPPIAGSSHPGRSSSLCNRQSI